MFLFINCILKLALMFFTVHWVKLFCVNVSVRQTAERYGYSRPLPVVRHYYRDYSAECTRLLRLQQSKTVVTLVCLGAVAGLYYSSLDRQSRRKFQATADGVARFLRYRCWDLLLASFDFNQLCLRWLSSWQTFIRANGLCYTQGDSDVILFHIYASWYLPPSTLWVKKNKTPNSCP